MSLPFMVMAARGSVLQTSFILSISGATALYLSRGVWFFVYSGMQSTTSYLPNGSFLRTSLR